MEHYIDLKPSGMDFNECKIDELKKKVMEQDFPDLIENHLREFITELYIKRDQVSQLRSDYACLHAENKELRENLEKANKTLEENNFNLSILSRKVQAYEQELSEKKHSLLQLNLQHKMAYAEIKSLKDILQKSEVERAELSKKVHLFEAELKHHRGYNNEFHKRENNLRVFVDEMIETMRSIREEQSQILKLLKCTDLAHDALLEVEKLKKENENLTREKNDFEKHYARARAKIDTLEEFMQNFQNEQPIDTNDFIFVQWRLNRKHYRQQLNDASETIANLIESYNNEKKANFKLIAKNEELNSAILQLSKDNEELTVMMKDLRHKYNELDKIIEVKEEPILISD